MPYVSGTLSQKLFGTPSPPQWLEHSSGIEHEGDAMLTSDIGTCVLSRMLLEISQDTTSVIDTPFAVDKEVMQKLKYLKSRLNSMLSKGADEAGGAADILHTCKHIFHMCIYQDVDLRAGPLVRRMSQLYTRTPRRIYSSMHDLATEPSHTVVMRDAHTVLLFFTQGSEDRKSIFDDVIILVNECARNLAGTMGLKMPMRMSRNDFTRVPVASDLVETMLERQVYIPPHLSSHCMAPKHRPTEDGDSPVAVTTPAFKEMLEQVQYKENMHLGRVSRLSQTLSDLFTRDCTAAKSRDLEEWGHVVAHDASTGIVSLYSRTEFERAAGWLVELHDILASVKGYAHFAHGLANRKMEELVSRDDDASSSSYEGLVQASVEQLRLHQLRIIEQAQPLLSKLVALGFLNHNTWMQMSSTGKAVSWAGVHITNMLRRSSVVADLCGTDIAVANIELRGIDVKVLFDTLNLSLDGHMHRPAGLHAAAVAVQDAVNTLSRMGPVNDKEREQSKRTFDILNAFSADTVSFNQRQLLLFMMQHHVHPVLVQGCAMHVFQWSASAFEVLIRQNRYLYMPIVDVAFQELFGHDRSGSHSISHTSMRMIQHFVGFHSMSVAEKSTYTHQMQERSSGDGPLFCPVQPSKKNGGQDWIVHNVSHAERLRNECAKLIAPDDITGDDALYDEHTRALLVPVSCSGAYAHAASPIMDRSKAGARVDRVASPSSDTRSGMQYLVLKSGLVLSTPASAARLQELLRDRIARGRMAEEMYESNASREWQEWCTEADGSVGLGMTVGASCYGTVSQQDPLTTHIMKLIQLLLALGYTDETVKSCLNSYMGTLNLDVHGTMGALSTMDRDAHRIVHMTQLEDGLVSEDQRVPVSMQSAMDSNVLVHEMLKPVGSQHKDVDSWRHMSVTGTNHVQRSSHRSLWMALDDVMDNA